MAPRAEISLLFDFFVTAQRVRRALAEGMTGSGMRPDEYAVYSLLFDVGPVTATEMSELLAMPLSTVLDYLKVIHAAGHLERMPHPSDGRALQVRLNGRGVAAHRRAHQHWEVVRKRIEGGLSLPAGAVRRALRDLGDAADGVDEPSPRARAFAPGVTAKSGVRWPDLEAGRRHLRPRVGDP